jgi:hypothetical protein
MKVKSTLIALIALFYSNFVNAQNTLDNIGLTSSTPASVAFSLRQLSTGYTGPLVRIKVGSSFYDVYPDASTKNFSLSSKISASISTYNAAVSVAGANALNTIITCTTNATVAIWYDQSGNAVNVLTNSTTGPKIITQGSIQLMSGKPSIYFAAVSANTSPLVSSTTVNYSAQQTATVNAVAQNVGSTSNISGIYSTGLSGGWGLNYDPTATAPGYWLDGSGCNQAFSGATSTTPKIVTGFLNKSTSSSIIYENSTLKGTKTMTCNIANGTADNICIGIRASNGGIRKFDGYISEVILFPSILISADQATLETNQNTTYFSPSVSISSSASCNTSFAGASVTFTANTQNFTSTPTYQWYKNGTAISGETSSTYSTTSLANNDQIYIAVTPANVSASTVTSNLIANLDAGNSSSYNGTGNTWTDLTGNGNNVTLSNTGYSTVNGGGIALNTNGYGTQTLASPPFNGDFTWSTIFRFNDGMWDWIYNVGGYNGLILTVPGKPGFSWGGWYNNKIDANAESSLTNGNYYMLTFVRSGNAISCYLQASPYGVGSSVSGNISLVSPLIGKAPDGSAPWPNGIVNLILLYNRALTQSEITQNYNTYAARFGFTAASISSNTITTTISTPSVTITSSASGAVCAGSNVTFTANAQNFASTPSYQWYKNGAIIPGANSSTYSTTSLNNNDQINVWLNGGIDNSAIVSNGMILNLDASSPSSYAGTGNTWYDLSGNNNHATLMNNPTYDVASGSIVTNGTNQYIAIPQVSTAVSNVTMQAWVYVNMNTTGTFMKNGSNGGGYSIGIGNNAFDQVGSNVVMLFSGRRWISTGTSFGSAGWKLITMTLDGSSVPRAYVNGTLIGSYVDATKNPIAPSGTFNLGANIGDGNIFYNGKFAAAYFYNRELSLAEIQQNYNATVGSIGVVSTNSISSNTITATISTSKTVNAASSIPTLCSNTALTNITHTTTGATGIGTATGLPAGVTAAFASNTITISGTPTASGTFNYTIPLTGGCGSVNATGTIIVNALDVLSPITAPVDVTVQAIGGGGGADGDWGASGGGGATAVKSLTLVAGDSVDITVGLGGISGIGWSGISGGNGGDSKAIFNSINIVAGGGKGPASGMAGGIATGGSINLKGGAGNGGGVKMPGFDGEKQGVYSAAGGGAGNYYDGLAPSYIYPGGLGGGLAGNGGHGSPQYPTGSNGESGFNYGGGGGGGGNYNGKGGAGGQGVVAITYSGTPIATGGTITQSGGFTTHTFSNPGSDTFTVQSANSAAVNMGLSLQLANATAGGTWSSSNTSIATVSNTGLVTGMGIGTANVSYSLTNSNGCTNLVSLSITVNPLNTSSAASSTPTLCINTALPNITHSTSGATGIGTATGLPAGVTAAFASNTITISGTPTATGTFNYTIPLTGGFGTVNATGTITVNTAPTVTVIVSGDACINKTILTATIGLSSYVWYKDNVAISGATTNTYTPIAAGDYKVEVSNGACSITSAVTTIYTCGVTADGKMSPISSAATLVSNEGAVNFGTGLNELGSILNTTSLTTSTGTIGATTAVLGGVIAATNAITPSIGVIYSTDINFATYSTANIQSNVAAGTYISTVSGLSSLTTYYAKSFILNKAGTSYGNVVSFTTTAPPPPAPGDDYGGGKVFYVFQPGDPGYVAGEYHGLIAATVDCDQGYATWGCRGWPTGVSQLLGSGYANTITILNCNENLIAAKRARAFTGGGYTDWYVPSKDELNLLYLNKHLVGAGGFVHQYGQNYWSSSESDANYGRYQDFSNGSQQWQDKNTQMHVRAIRTF